MAFADPKGTAYLGGRPSHLIFRELRKEEVRRIPLLRGWVNSYPSAEGVDLLLEIVGLSTSAQRHISPTEGSNDLRKETQCTNANKEKYTCQLFHRLR
jgi:hypothetical protein